MLRKLLIKSVARAVGGLSSYLDVKCTDGSSFSVPRSEHGGIPLSELEGGTTIAELTQDGEVVSRVKLISFDNDGRPDKHIHITGEPLMLDGTEEIIDCRR